MLPDPRLYSLSASNDEIGVLAMQSLATEIAVHQEKLDDRLRAALHAALRAGEGARIQQAIDHAPGPDVARHIWRRLAEAFSYTDDATLVARLFAFPVVLVAAASEPLSMSGVLSDTNSLRATLREHDALAGNENFALSNVLVDAAGLDLDRLPELYAWQSLPPEEALPKRVLEAPMIELVPSHESVHLRFLAGVALTGAGANLFEQTE